jgi:hypothetical protein
MLFNNKNHFVFIITNINQYISKIMKPAKQRAFSGSPKKDVNLFALFNEFFESNRLYFPNKTYCVNVTIYYSKQLSLLLS